MNKKKAVKTVLITMLIIILLSINGTPQAWSKQTKLPWYDVEEWELDVCSKWGGRQQADTSENNQQLETDADVTITIQAKKTKTDTGRLYEVTYFFDSYSATTSYKIKLSHTKTNQEKELTQGTLIPGTGTADYWVQELKEEYNVAIIEHNKGTIVTPIIEAR